MLNGDISNRQSPIIAFNLDNLLFTKEESKDSLVKKLSKLIKTDKQKFLSKEVDKNFVNKINNLWIKHPYSIYFITFTPYKEELFSILDKNSVSYTSLEEFLEWDDIRIRCSNNYFMYYFDTDENLLSYISTSNALHIDELPNRIK